MSTPAATHAHLIHSTPYRNSSLLTTFISADHGLLRCVARGARGTGKSRAWHLHPFDLLQLNYSGRGDLKTLTACELIRLCRPKGYTHQAAGLYVNEILYYLKPDEEGARALFDAYERVLAGLAAGHELVPLLRRFELQLAAISGYALLLDEDVPDRLSLCFSGETGLTADAQAGVCPAGVCRKFLAGDELTAHEWRRISRLMRPVIAHLVGHRTIHARELLI